MLWSCIPSRNDPTRRFGPPSTTVNHSPSAAEATATKSPDRLPTARSFCSAPFAACTLWLPVVPEVAKFPRLSLLLDIEGGRRRAAYSGATRLSCRPHQFRAWVDRRSSPIAARGRPVNFPRRSCSWRAARERTSLPLAKRVRPVYEPIPDAILDETERQGLLPLDPFEARAPCMARPPSCQPPETHCFAACRAVE